LEGYSARGRRAERRNIPQEGDWRRGGISRKRKTGGEEKYPARGRLAERRNIPQEGDGRRGEISRMREMEREEGYLPGDTGQ
jgi:hypothetical protein